MFRIAPILSILHVGVKLILADLYLTALLGLLQSWLYRSSVDTYIRSSYWTEPSYSYGGPFSSGIDLYVSPWETEYLPNPVIFRCLYLLYAGYQERIQAEERAVHETREIVSNEDIAQEHTTDARVSQLVPSTPTPTLDSSEPLHCTQCNLTFPTRGVKQQVPPHTTQHTCRAYHKTRKHVNRKHVRRFSCDICTLAFSLRADLERHKRTVHRNGVERGEARSGFVCKNAKCSLKGKVFARKDNFRRHVRRCGG